MASSEGNGRYSSHPSLVKGKCNKYADLAFQALQKARKG